MKATEPPDHSDESAGVEPQDPDYIRLMALLRSRAEQSKAAKDASFREWSADEDDEDIIADLGLDMDVLRQDP